MNRFDKRQTSRFVHTAASAFFLAAAVSFSSFPAFAGTDYSGLAVANVRNDALNLRNEPSTDGEIIGKCYRGSGGVVLARQDGWTKIQSGDLTGWMSDKYLLFGAEIEPLIKELGLLSAKVTAQTLNVREEPTTDSDIVGQAAKGESYPVLSEDGGWAQIQLSAEVSGYVSTEYAKVQLAPGEAVDVKTEEEALKKAESKAPDYVIGISQDEIYLMAACVMMEAGGYSYDGQLAVASVIVNRVKSGKWGGSVSSVIYAEGQFPGATSGLMDKYLSKGPSDSVLKAVKAALSGENNVGSHLYFKSAKSANPENYASYKIIGGNFFYG